VLFPVRVGDLPVVGGGGDFTLALGDGGELIGYTGVWRSASDAFDAAVIPQERADETYRELFAAAKGLELRSVSSYLAYYAAPSFIEQDFLNPVYIYLGTAQIGDEEVPLRAVTLPATDFGPKLELPPPVPARPKRARAAAPPASEKRKRRAYETAASAPRAPLALAATKPRRRLDHRLQLGRRGGLRE
jgi:hypothetical protein